MKQYLSIKFVLTLSILVLGSGTAAAASYAWNCSSYYWEVSTCWSPYGVPTSADTVTIGTVGGADTTAMIDIVVVNAYAGSLTIDAAAGTNVSLKQSGSTLTVTGNEVVGDYGSGSIMQSGGTNAVGGDLVQGLHGVNSNNSYVLSGSGSLAVTGTEFIGYNATGSFVQSGGTNKTAWLGIGTVNGGFGSGTYTLQGGTLTVLNNIFGGGGGTSTLNLDGGNLSVGGGNGSINISTLMLASTSGSSGSHTLSGTGSISAYFEDIGYYGTGNFTQSGGSNQVSNLYLGYQAGSNGSYDLTNGSLTDTFDEGIGVFGSGIFTQSGGSNQINGDLNLGILSGSHGTYTLGDGSLIVNGNIVGGSGSSSLVINGGDLSVGGGNGSISVSLLGLGYSSGSHGSYNLSGAGSVSATIEEIGGVGTGSFIQSGGANQAGSLFIGDGPGSNSSYDLSGGSLSAATENIGTYSNGSFTQSGGANQVNNNLYLGNASYTLSGGSLSTGGNIVNVGTSTLNLDGGSMSVAGGTGSISVTNLNLGSTAGSNGTLTLSSTGIFQGSTQVAGALQVSNVTVGVAGSGTFTQTGGVLSVDSFVNNDTTALNGGTLTVNGSLNNYNSLTMAGGTINGSGMLENDAAMSGYGTIGGSGGLTNYGLFSQGAGTLVLSSIGTNTNYGNMDMAGGHLVQLSGSGVTLNNVGSLNMNGAIVTGSGKLDNNLGGTVAGRGSIASGFSNEGTVAVSGGNLGISKAFDNSGVIQMTGPTSSLTGGAINNTGAVQGSGNIANAIANTGTIEATGGSLNLSGTINNNAGGTIRAATGNKVLAVNGIAANAGLISLAGGTVDTNGHAMISSGSIDGYGVLATGGLTNEGNMTLSGGTATVNGGVTNNNKITVAYSPAVFTGAVVNNGQFKATSTNVIFAGSYTENGSYISDPSTTNYTDVTIGASGYWTGGVGDIFQISGDFTNNSLKNTDWNTDNASLVLNGTGSQDLYLAGFDLGVNLSSFVNNFAWGSLDIANGQTISLFDGNSTADAALYLNGALLGINISGDSVSNIVGNGFDIYYNPNVAENDYLHGLTYNLGKGGYLMAANTPTSSVPEPNSWELMLAGLMAMEIIERRRCHGKAADIA